MAVQGTPSSSDSSRILFRATTMSESCADQNANNRKRYATEQGAEFVVRKTFMCVCKEMCRCFMFFEALDQHSSKRWRNLEKRVQNACDVR